MLERIRGAQKVFAPGMERLKELFDFGFVEARQLFLAFDNHRAPEQIRILEHELDRLVFRRRLLGSSPMISRNSLSVNGFLLYSLSSKSIFFDCKKLLALRQVVHVDL
jgi:hypothetical protein